MSPALRVALSIAVMRAPCSPAALSSNERYICIASACGSSLAQDGFLVRLELIDRAAQIGVFAFRRRRSRDDLLFGHHLGDHRVEAVVDDRRHVDFASRQHRGDAGADLLGIGEFDPAFAGVADVADQFGWLSSRRR